LRKFEYRHQVADAEFSFSLKQENNAQSDRIGKSLEGLSEMFHRSIYNAVVCYGQWTADVGKDIGYNMGKEKLL